MAFIEFNANDVPESDLLPNGDYLMMVTDSDIIEPFVCKINIPRFIKIRSDG